jgi:hypothetical protein
MSTLSSWPLPPCGVAFHSRHKCIGLQVASKLTLFFLSDNWRKFLLWSLMHWRRETSSPKSQGAETLSFLRLYPSSGDLQTPRIWGSFSVPRDPCVHMTWCGCAVCVPSDLLFKAIPELLAMSRSSCVTTTHKSSSLLLNHDKVEAGHSPHTTHVWLVPAPLSLFPGIHILWLPRSGK